MLLPKRGIVPCIPSKTNRKISIPHDRTLYHQRHKIENMFGRLKDWRRIPYPLRPLLPHLFLSHLYRSNRHLLDQTMSPEPSHLELKFVSHYKMRFSFGGERSDGQYDGPPDGAVGAEFRMSESI